MRYLDQNQLVRMLLQLGCGRGDLLMVHASLRKVGPVVGPVDAGADAVIDALLGVVGPGGTICAYADWEPTASLPYFDPSLSPCALDHGIFPEILRHRAGALRSNNPGASVLALGPHAPQIVYPHPLNYGYGVGTPFDRFISLGGKVLLLGAPLDSVTILHYAESIAPLRDKRIVSYSVPMLSDGHVQSVRVEEYDTSHPVVSGMPANYFELIVAEYLESEEIGASLIGSAPSYLLDAQKLVTYAAKRMELEFG